MKRILTTAALAAVLAAGGSWVLSPSAQPPLGAAGAQEAASPVVDMTLGQADAPVEIIEYGSFTCPHCAAFEETVFPQIKENYIDTGKVKFTFREAYFNKYDMWASLMARCGGEMKYFGIVDMIYSTQNEWARQSSEQGVADAIRKMGLQAGIGQEELDACMQDGEQLKALVAWYQGNVEKDGFNSTPSFIVDGELHSNMPYDEFSKLLDERYEAAQ
ncbi:MAG: DsbA family protein [Rhodobacteraceae bacterium]|uniref:Protein-disulfide isomerase n=1 Tax=Salipiger thiooxidans TaxID=282683 RepID=A0A1G7AQG6_9RHOB|nr:MULTISPECIES: DsbA family protein [Salipiger]MAU46771.1 thiol-disulfide oxidoreductase [Salipiger sp.]NIY96013.1 DsbA family protein [Salipiger sp. HF18]NVK62160.1 DsbA family protein [Paracoccaceae bacterium]SDE16940.1 Protein-disulfide isomerase [Salipiger thiooxidans]